VAKSKKTAAAPVEKGPRKSRIPRPVQSRGFALVGLFALAPIAWLLLKGRLDLESAAQRAAFVLVGLMLLERVLAPLVLAILNSGRPGEPKADEETPARVPGA
jgi:hypothetical protein